MKYVTLTDSLYLVSQEVSKSGKTVSAPKNLNHIMIYDRSGSMYGVLGRLCEDLKERLRTVPVGDTVTLGWFSGEGDFNLVLKGFKITSKDDYKKLDQVIDQNNTTRNTTCFSEVLADLETVVKDLSILGNNFALCFFTDGYPVVSNYDKEIKAINKAISNINGKVTSSLLIGYGSYYNKELMVDMAERLGGSVIHSSDLKNIPATLNVFMDKARDNEAKILAELHALPHSDGAVFSLSENQVVVYQVENGQVAFSPTKAAVDRIFTLTNKAPKNGEEVDLDVTPTAHVDTTGDNVGKYRVYESTPQSEPYFKAAYAAAYVLTQRTKTDLALDVLSRIGDVGLVERVSNAFTNAEYGMVEQMIMDAIGSKHKRFLGGRKVGCLPKPNAFCLMNALDMLMVDEEAEFYPFHEEFHYNKIGVSSKTKDGYPKFEADKTARVPMSDLVWNDTKLNLSIRAKIPGTIDLDNRHKKFGLEKTFDTYVWRNYTVVKDGFLNVTTLPVTLSKSSYDVLLAEGVIDQEHNRHYKGRAYVLHLDRIPVINRQIAEGKTSAADLCHSAFDEITLMSDLKVMNFLRNEIEPKDQRELGTTYTEEQEEYLKELGVGKGGVYSPPTVKLDPTDFYMAKEFEIKIKGFSSLPKVDDVFKKRAEAKAFTPSVKLMDASLRKVEKIYKSGDTHKRNRATLKQLDDVIKNTKTTLNSVRSSIQRTKFSVILAKKWFNEFSSREDNKLTVDGNEFTIGVREVRVEV